jgi:hypothetical protein
VAYCNKVKVDHNTCLSAGKGPSGGQAIYLGALTQYSCSYNFCSDWNVAGAGSRLQQGITAQNGTVIQSQGYIVGNRFFRSGANESYLVYVVDGDRIITRDNIPLYTQRVIPAGARNDATNRNYGNVTAPNAANTFRVTNTLLRAQSVVHVQQESGTPQPITVGTGAGTFTVTAPHPFAGTELFRWELLLH